MMKQKTIFAAVLLLLTIPLILAGPPSPPGDAPSTDDLPQSTSGCSEDSDCSSGEYCGEDNTCQELEEQELIVNATNPAHGSSKPEGTINFSATITTTFDEVTCYLSIYPTSEPANVSLSDPVETTQDTIIIPYEIEELDVYIWKIVCEQEYQEQTYENETDLNTLNVEHRSGILNVEETTLHPGNVFEYELIDFRGDITLSAPGLFDDMMLVINDDETFYGTLNISMDAELGTYDFSVQHNDIEEKHAEQTINITLPESELFLSDNNVENNETISIIGKNFLIQQDITLTITQEEYELVEEITTNQSGGFSQNYTTEPYLQGNFTIIAFHNNRSDSNATTTLHVLEETVNETANETEPEPEPCDGCERGDNCYEIGTIVSGEYCSTSGFQNQKPDGDSCSQNYECQFAQCTSGTCGEPETTPPEPDCQFNSDCNNDEECEQGVCIPRTEQPTPIPTPEVSDEESSSMLWWIVILVIFVGLIGGFFGFLSYEDALDMSSLEGFTDGVKDAFGAGVAQPHTPSKHATSGDAFSTNNLSNKPTTTQPTNQPTAAHEQKAMSYIQSKRTQGYDDLTIRNALLKQGWPEEEVDNVFDTLYKQ